MSTASKALSVKNVIKNYGAVRALKGVSFEIPSGQVFGLLGPNGAGKTSLISILVTLEKATAGQVEIFGADVEREPRWAKLQTGWVPQEVINHGFFTVEEILNFYAGYFGQRHPRERIHYLMSALDLTEHRNKKVKQLSGGMKRRLMIAKALVHRPRLLLLDEPTAGVDVELRTRLWDFVSELKSEGLSILLTTHYLEEAEQLCDQVAIIHEGEIQALGSTQVLIDQWSRKRISLKLSGHHQQPVHSELVEFTAGEWVFNVPTQKPLGLLLSELGVSLSDLRDIQVVEGRLEDAFLQLTAKKGAT